jgi:hypothetical protein
MNPERKRYFYLAKLCEELWILICNLEIKIFFLFTITDTKYFNTFLLSDSFYEICAVTVKVIT